MRPVRLLAVCVAGALLCSGLTSAARADDDTDIPTRGQVQDARAAVDSGERDVAAVQADLAAANAAVEAASIRAAQEAEAFNGARYTAGRAAQAAEAARAKEAQAEAELERLREVYAESIVVVVHRPPRARPRCRR